MRTQHAIRVAMALGLLVTFGAGCAISQGSGLHFPTSTSTGASSTGTGAADPLEAAKKIIPEASSVITMRESFTGPGLAYARTLGYGPEVTRTIALQRYAPRVLSSLQWKADTQITEPNVKTGKPELVNKQYVGTLNETNLQSSHELYPPIYWNGEQSAAGSGGLWISQDVFEDLSKVHESTLKYGVEDGEFLDRARSTDASVISVVKDLQSRINAVIDRTDVFLTTATTGTDDLLVDGTTTTVQVIRATNWFGTIDILDNPDDPLILRMKIGNPGGMDFGGLYDYEITEIKDIIKE